MTYVWFGLVALAGLSAFGMLVAAVRLFPLIGALFIIANVFILWEVPYPPALANIAGISIYLLDVFAGAFLLVGLIQVRSLRRNVGSVGGVWLALGFLLLLSLFRGLAENPLGSTFTEFRSYLYPFAAFTWAMSLSWTRALSQLLIARTSLVFGWGLVAVAGFHLYRYGFGSTSGFVDVGSGVEQTTRPLVGTQALALLLCTIVVILHWRSEGDSGRRRGLLLSATLFSLVVVISQHRSVWGAGAAALILVFLVSRIRAKRLMIGVALAASWLFAIVLTANVFPDVLNKLAIAVADAGTYDARVNGWTALIAQSFSTGPISVLFGQPMGSGFGRFEGGDRWVEFAPHNWYVTIYLRAGLVGFVLLLSVVALGVHRLIRQRDNLAATAIIAVIILFGWSYSWPWTVCLFFGWALASGTKGVVPLESEVLAQPRSLSRPASPRSVRKVINPLSEEYPVSQNGRGAEWASRSAWRQPLPPW